MSDEIDIEEHDVLDNPSLKRIFPDLSVIKQEINQYYDEALSPLPDTTFEESTQAVNETKPDPQNSNDFVSASPLNDSEITEPQKQFKNLHENIIILGSKPNLDYEKNNYKGLNRQKPKLILQNISSFLNKCNRYCKVCLILFPKTKVFNLHMHKDHNQNIHTDEKYCPSGRDRSSRIKNNVDTKNQKKLTEKQAKPVHKLFRCNTCNKILSSQAHLVNHIKNLHETKLVYEAGEKSVQKDVTKSKKTTQLSCFHCQQLFTTQSSLIEHLYEVLEPPRKTSDCSISTSEKAMNKMVKINDMSMVDKDESKNTKTGLEFCSLETLDQHDRDDHLNHKTKLDVDNSENILPRKSKRRNLNSVVAFTDSTEKKVNKKRQATNINSKQKENTDNNRLKTKKSNECTQQFNSKKKLEYHMNKEHIKKYKTSILKYKAESSMEKEMEHSVVKKRSPQKLPTMLFKCFICSKYTESKRVYSRHIKTEHNVKEITKLQKVRFDSQCKFCAYKLINYRSYNKHLQRYHGKRLKERIFTPVSLKRNRNKIRSALKSILYKCMKCDIFFLSSHAAMDHSQHIENLSNWKCLVCERIFREEDRALHVKQHSFSQTFTVHTISESAFCSVLYKCSNCTVHYSEETLFMHYPKCESETPNSLYCKVCDILINRDDMDLHESNHKEKKMLCSNFTIIESDIIDDKRRHPIKAKSKKDIYEQTLQYIASLQENSMCNLAMIFCHTCKGFVSHIKHGRGLHVKAKCAKFPKTVCKKCGLLLTHKAHATHQELHKKMEVSLQDYTFFDLKSTKQICPPIPEYPKCDMCEVHFLRNSAIKNHVCYEQDYISCNICSIKLTEHAYKLHVAFHNYSIKTVNTNLNDTELEFKIANDVSYEDPNVCVSDNSVLTDVIFYTCKSCRISFNTYDKVIEHCQDHYDCKEVQLETRKCQNCIFIFAESDYEYHNKLHINGKYEKDSLKVVDFDPFYFRFNNDIWIKHIFAYVADKQIRKIVDTSMYKYECRLKMEELQAGCSNKILYKCERCRIFIEPNSLYTHAKNSRERSCVAVRKHPCSYCGLNFVSLTYRMAHEKQHGIDNIKSYKIILYNKTKHETFNSIMYDACNRYILYQCRNCERVVDKFQRKDHQCDVNNLQICVTCGLLLHKQDYDLHFIRHEELDTFIAKNIILVMFGKSDPDKNDFKSTFSGTKYDYTIYKCKNCNLCLRTKTCMTGHVCVFDDSKCKCSNCGLYFTKQELKYHSELHESNLEFDEFSMNVITFDTAINRHVDPKEKLEENNDVGPKETVQDNNDSHQINIAKEKNCLVKEISNIFSENREKIYKCDCGLHFLEECNAQQHANICNVRMKISKQSCFKCDLLFTPGELFNHLLKHHCEKKLQYKFDVVCVSKKAK